MFRTRTLVSLVGAFAFTLGTLTGVAPSSADDTTPPDQPSDFQVDSVETRKSCEAEVETRIRYDVFGYVWGGGAWVATFEESMYTPWHYNRDLSEQESTDLDCAGIGALEDAVATSRAHLAAAHAKVDGLRDRLAHVKARKDARIERLLDRLHR